MKAHHLINVLAILILAACSTPTPIAQQPSPEPSATSLPPTATATMALTDTPTATATASPTRTSTPTVTSTATATSTRTPSVTKAVLTATTRPTKNATATTAPSANTASQPVSNIPAGAPLNVAVRRTFENVQVILGELNQAMTKTGGRCSIVMPHYDAIATAPTYDVSGQSSDVQTAYALYRQGIDTINSTAPQVRRICNQGGGAINKLDIGEAHQSTSQAIGFLGRALDLLPPVPAATDSLVATATPVVPVSSIALSDLLLKTMERIRGVGSMLGGAQLDINSGFCQQFVPEYNSLIVPVRLDDTNRPPAWNEQYNAYKVILQYFQGKAYRLREVCDAGGGKIGTAEFSEIYRGIDTAAIAAARAYDGLKQHNLLGQ